MRSGYIQIQDGVLRHAGQNGQGWSSRAAAFTSDTSATAYYLEFRATAVNPSNGPNNRWNGFTLRCLVRGAVPIFENFVIIISMKIAIFTDIYAPWGTGGVASSIKAQKDALESLGHEVTVFCPGFDAREKNVVNVPSHKILRINNSVVSKRPTVVEEFVLGKFPNFAEFDVVHVHYEASCSLAGVRLARRFGLPLVQTMHGREDMAIAINVAHPWKTLVAQLMNILHNKYLPHDSKIKRDKFQAPTRARAKMWELVVNQAEYADVVITPSAHFAYKLEHYGVTRPIRVVSNGVSESLVAADFALRKLDDGDVLKMIWNSRASREKRILPFLQAVALLERPYILYVYGDGNELKRAKKYVRKHDLKVKFYGMQKREKIIERMREAHLGIMASYNFDTQGMTLLEAEATGLPVFFCDPNMREVVPNGSYVLAGGPEAAAMAIALQNLLAEQIAKMSQQMLKNRQKVLQSAQVETLLAVYDLARQKRP